MRRITDLILRAIQRMRSINKLPAQLGDAIIREFAHLIRPTRPTAPVDAKAAAPTLANTLQINWGRPHQIVRSPTTDCGRRELTRSGPPPGPPQTRTHMNF